MAMLQEALKSAVLSESVLAVGFDADDFLRTRYAGRVAFRPMSNFQKPSDLPNVDRILMRTGYGVSENDVARMINLSKARNIPWEPTGSLPVLRDRLAELFPDPKPKDTPSPPVKLPGAPGLAQIRAVKTKPGTVSDWVRLNMRYPCSAGAEADRLLALAPKDLNANRPSIYQALVSLVCRSGLRREAIVATRASTAVDSLATDSPRLLASIQEIINSFGAFENATVGRLRSLQQQIKQVEVASSMIPRLQAENEKLLEDLKLCQERARAAEKSLEDLRAQGRKIFAG